MSNLQKANERVIQVYNSTNAQVTNITCSSNKWSDIAAELEKTGLDLTNKKAVLGSTKGTLELPDALIPEGNQIIYLVQSKMKSGATKLKGYEGLTYNELRNAFKIAKEKHNLASLGGNPTRSELISSLESVHKLKGSKAVKRAEKVKTIREEATKGAPNLEERIVGMETALSTVVEGFNNILVSLGRRTPDTTGSSASKANTIKTADEIAREFEGLDILS